MPGCDGPTNEEYSTVLQACVGSTRQTSCTGSETCYYAALQFSPMEWMGGRFVEGESGPFRIECPGSLTDIGIKEGTIIDSLNGQPVTVEAITQFTPEAPAKCAAHFKLAGGKRDLHLLR